MHGSPANLLRAAALMVVAIPLCLAVSAPASGQETSDRVPVIRVSGEGVASLAPDMAVLQLGVLREAPTAREALDEANRAMAAVIAELKRTGVEPADLQTSGFSVQPRYHHPQNRSGELPQPPKIVGYTVSNNLTVRVRDLEGLGRIIDRSVSLGMNSDGNIRFTHSDPEPAITEARAKAMVDARKRAETLAAAANVELGPIVEIVEQTHSVGPTPMARDKLIMAAAESVPVETGENTYEIRIEAVWKIRQ